MTKVNKLEIYENVLRKLAHYYSTSESAGIDELCKNCDRWVYSLNQEPSEENQRLIDWTYRTLDKTPLTERIIRHRLKKKKTHA
jgi:hypothetical protein